MVLVYEETRSALAPENKQRVETSLSGKLRRLLTSGGEDELLKHTLLRLPAECHVPTIVMRL